MSEKNPLSLGRLRIPVKLTLLVAALGLVALAIAGSLVGRQRTEIEAVRTQRIGVEYLHTLHSLFQQIDQHRSALNNRFFGVPEDRDLEALRGRISGDLATLSSLESRLRIGTANDTFATVKRNWQNIAGRIESFEARQSFDAHSRVLEDLADLALIVGEEAGLRTPPDLATFYLADTAMVRLLEAALPVGSLRGAVIGIAAAGSLGEEERAGLLSSDASVDSAMEAVGRNLELAFVQGSGLRQEGEGVWRTANGRVEVFLASIDQELVRSDEPLELSSRAFDESGKEALQQLFALAEFNLRALDRLLNERLLKLNRQLLIAAGALAIGFLFSGLIAWLIARGVTQQLREITGVLQQIGIGNYNARVAVRTQDELGQVARTLNGMLDSTLILIQSREQRDVQLGRIITDVKNTALEVGGAAQEIQSRTEELASGSDAQNDKISETSNAIGRMAASIQQVSANCASAATVARNALQNAQEGASAVARTAQGMNAVRDRVQETSKRIKRLGESSQEIGEIAKLINDIAERTSMLAINAAIQAASAGEYGRGFAVVANEVERLAERSADATKRIETLISTIQSETSQTAVAMEETTREVVEGSGLATDAGQILGDIEDVSRRLAQLIEAISVASTEQAGTSEVVAEAMGEISQVSQVTASGTRDAASSVRDLAGLLDSLRESVLAISVSTKAA